MKFYWFGALFIVSALPGPYSGLYTYVRTASQQIKSENSFRILSSIQWEHNICSNLWRMDWTQLGLSATIVIKNISPDDWGPDE